MSKPTMAERAAARVQELGPLGTISPPWLALQLEQFAAAEVARVREMQTRPVKILRALLKNGGDWYTSSDAIKAIDEATRPERPARAMANPGLSALARTVKKRGSR